MSTAHISVEAPVPVPADAVIIGPDLPPHLAEKRRTEDAIWLPVSADLTETVAPVADRDDLIVSAVAATLSGAKANFIMPWSTIEVDRSAFGAVDPATLRPARPNDRYRYPAAFGALVHEAAHAAHSTWTPGDVTGRAPAPVIEAASLLDESRIEAAQIRRRPDDRLWLRAAVTILVWPELSAAGIASRSSAAQAAALVLARHDAGVLDSHEVAPIREAVEAILGREKLSELEAIWRRVLTLADDDVAGILSAGEAWCRVIGIDPDDRKPSGGEPEYGAHDPSGAGPAEPSAADRLSTAMAETGARISLDVAAATASIAATETADAEAEAKAKAERRAAAEVFSRQHTGAGRGRRSPVVGTRPPTAAERGAAASLAKALRAASVRNRSLARSQTELPPGRLRMRGAMTRDAQRAAGAIPTAKPFTATIRRHSERPPLRVGIAVDVSGSMKPVAAPVASAAWILSRAVTAADSSSKTATVAFGDTVTPITRPGANATQVTEFRARCNTEEFTQAVSALDLELDLSRPGTARLLVVVSDGVFRTDQSRKGQVQLKALTDAGCAVLWLTLGTARAAREASGISFVSLPDPTTAADEIGRAAVAALKAAR